MLQGKDAVALYNSPGKYVCAREDAGVPDVRGVWLHPGAYRFFSIVKPKQRYPGHAQQAALVASQYRPGAYLGHYVVVVDDDIYIYNSDDVIWAIGMRSEPENIDILRRAGAVRSILLSPRA